MLEALNYEGLTAAHAQDEAVVCALHFERVRDKLLMMYAWKFVRAVNTPTANELSGNTRWKYYFPKPADCLFVLGNFFGSLQFQVRKNPGASRKLLPFVCNRSGNHGFGLGYRYDHRERSKDYR